MKNEKPNVSRINLKTATAYRPDLISFCLNKPDQRLAIGWSCVYPDNPDLDTSEKDFFQLYDDWKTKNGTRTNPVINILKETTANDLFWTRDLNGHYWICRATDKACPYCDKRLDIGLVLPVQAYKIGSDVPGQIKASFNRARGGTAERLKNSLIVEYSKNIFNQASGTKEPYQVNPPASSNLLSSLPDFELEELVISYLQISKGFYVLSNSIANKSTTIKIECELRSKTIPNEKAVVQVKGGDSITLSASDFDGFVRDGYYVYLKAPHVKLDPKTDKVIEITDDELLDFYFKHKTLLPDSITKWEDLFCNNEANKIEPTDD